MIPNTTSCRFYELSSRATGNPLRSTTNQVTFFPIDERTGITFSVSSICSYAYLVHGLVAHIVETFRLENLRYNSESSIDNRQESITARSACKFWGILFAMIEPPVFRQALYSPDGILPEAFSDSSITLRGSWLDCVH